MTHPYLDNVKFLTIKSETLQSRSFDEDNHVNAVDHVITDRPGSGDSPKENSLEKDDDVFEGESLYFSMTSL